MTESSEQAALIEWCDWKANQGHEALGWIFHIPNGGKRDVEVGAILKAQGVRPGVPDLFLPYPNRQGFHGLFIEMKVRPNTTSLAQAEYLRWLNSVGYLALLANGWDEARGIIERYLGI